MEAGAQRHARQSPAKRPVKTPLPALALRHANREPYEPRDRRALVSATLLVALVAFAAGCVGLVSAAAPRLVLLAFVALVGGLTTTAVVVTSSNPRRVGLLFAGALAMALSFTGVHVRGPVTLPLLASVLLLGITYLPGVVSRGAGIFPKGSWAVYVAATMTLGGVIAALAGRGDFIPILQFAATALVTTLAVVRLAPGPRAMDWLVGGLVTGILVSTTVGLVGVRGQFGRALGLTTQANQYAQFAVMALPLVWFLWRRSRLAAPLALTAGALLLAGVLQSGSRSGLLGFAVIVVLWAWRELGLAASFLVGAGVACLVALFPLPSVDAPTVERAFGSDSTARSNANRLDAMEAGYERLVEGNVLLGSGLPRTDLPHNVLLLVWEGMGLLGVGALLFLLWTTMRPAFRRASPFEEWAFSLATSGFVVAVALNNAIGAPAAWLIIALLQVARQHNSPAGAGGAHRAARAPRRQRTPRAARATP